MLLVGGFSRDLLFTPAPSFLRHSILTAMTLIGSQDLALKSRPNLFTHSLSPLSTEHLSSGNVTIHWQQAIKRRVILASGAIPHVCRFGDNRISGVGGMSCPLSWMASQARPVALFISPRPTPAAQKPTAEEVIGLTVVSGTDVEGPVGDAVASAEELIDTSAVTVSNIPGDPGNSGEHIGTSAVDEYDMTEEEEDNGTASTTLEEVDGGIGTMHIAVGNVVIVGSPPE
ncbi:hypothetical protein PR048_032265 [Dryococelus australis]|uniref:Uncharacterized protein n=1 Tax=Dryococelus australis TaxID=614101 RepID=A0ABQ9G1R2_9NEOP|nr:hypothetical protein PR048_032265 [Dryococelus australis]